MNTLQSQLIFKRERVVSFLVRKMRFIAYKQSALEEEWRGKLHQRRKLERARAVATAK